MKESFTFRFNGQAVITRPFVKKLRLTQAVISIVLHEFVKGGPAEAQIPWHLVRLLMKNSRADSGSFSHCTVLSF